MNTAQQVPVPVSSSHLLHPLPLWLYEHTLTRVDTVCSRSLSTRPHLLHPLCCCGSDCHDGDTRQRLTQHTQLTVARAEAAAATAAKMVSAATQRAAAAAGERVTSCCCCKHVGHKHSGKPGLQTNRPARCSIHCNFSHTHVLPPGRYSLVPPLAQAMCLINGDEPDGACGMQLLQRCCVVGGQLRCDVQQVIGTRPCLALDLVS